MIFLNPAVLFGLLAASIPVIIHLFNLRKLKKIDFSTLAFLKELQKNKIRKIKLKQWILLALRVLIILFIVTAFARPTLKSVSIGGTTSAAKTSAVFILDDTFSMSVVDQKGSYFNQAKEIIKEIISQLQEGDETGVILVSNPDEEIALSSNLSEFIKNLEMIDINFISGNLDRALIRAAQVLSESKNFNKEIYLLSDFQKNKISDEKTENDLSELFNENIRLYSFNLSSKEVFNISIDDIVIENQILEKEKPVNFLITITNNSNQDISSSVVSLFMDKERSAQKSFDLSTGQSKVIDIQATPKSSGFVDVFAEIETDEIDNDNKRFANLFIPEKISVGVFAENQGDLSFVKLALRTAGENRYTIEEKNINQLNTTRLDNYEVIIIAANEIKPAAEKLKNFAVEGGGLILFPSSNPDVQKLNQLYPQLGLGINSEFIGQVGTDNLKLKIDKTEFEHPVFKDLFQNKADKKYESPELNAYYRLSAAGNKIITVADGAPFLIEQKAGRGKIFIFNSAPVLSWSDFPLKSIFAPLINKSVVYLSAKDRDQNLFLAGEEAVINLKNSNAPQIKIIKPDNSEILIKLDDNQNRNYINFNNTDVAGNYKFFAGDNLFEVISVNTDPAESKTEYASESDFENYLNQIKFAGKHFPIKKDANINEKIMQARFGSELWRYFLLIAIILALVEMTIARNAKKDWEGIKI